MSFFEQKLLDGMGTRMNGNWPHSSIEQGGLWLAGNAFNFKPGDKRAKILIDWDLHS